MVGKIVACVASASAMTVMGTGAYFYLTSDYTIKALFEKGKGNKSNLTKNSENKKQWLDKWKAYIADNTVTGTTTTKNNPWNIGNWETNKDKIDDVPNEFAEGCENKLNDKVSGIKDQKYLDFLKWCVK